MVYKLLGLIFLIGILIRFLYFPDNIYFGYDQARDFYASLEILKGDFKIIGPPSSFNDKLFHGPLVYYIFSPLLFLFQGNPEAVSFFLRIFNALGILIIFLIGSILFNKGVGLMSAFLFAISYEQSQYALFLGHPALAVVPVLLFYLGLTLLFFKKDQRGLLLTALALGLAIHFHYCHILLLTALFLSLIIFRKKYQLKVKFILISFLLFLSTISTFILSEVKFNFRMLSIVFSSGQSFKISGEINYVLLILQRFIHDNFVSQSHFQNLVLIILILALGIILKDRWLRPKIYFLLFWLLGGLLLYFLIKTPSYYYNAGASGSLLILASYMLTKIFSKSFLLGFLLLILIVFNNLNLEFKLNHQGPNSDMVIQPGMLLADEKKILDFIYQKAQGQPFAVKALTIPLSVNTTWSYLFNWYGQKQYHYLPVWIGPTAKGYYDSLEITDARSNLPKNQFLIIEPTLGLRESLKKEFFREEGYFTKVSEEKRVGNFLVQQRYSF